MRGVPNQVQPCELTYLHMLRCSHILKYAHPGLHTHVLSCPYVCKHMPLTAEPRAFTTVSLPFTDLTPIPSRDQACPGRHELYSSIFPRPLPTQELA